MAKITISGLEVLFNATGNQIPVYARVYASQTFTNDDGQVVIGGSIDSPDFVKEVAVSYAAGVATIASFAGANAIDSTTFGIAGGVLATYVLGLYSAKGKRLAIVYAGLIVPSVPTTTTWTDINLYTNAQHEPYRNAYYTADQINALLNGLDLAPKATDVIYGKSRLSFLQSSLTDPIAVGDNDPIIRATRKTVYLETYGFTQANFNTALAAIGSVTQTELKITSQVSITADTTVPANVLISLEGNGSFTVATSRTLTIGSIVPPAKYQVFFGTGSTVFASNATGGVFHLEWWAGVSNAGDCSHAFAQAKASATNNLGGILKIGAGTWRVTNFDFGNDTIIEGVGNDTAGVGATVLTVPSLTINSSVLKISGAFRNRVVRNLCLSVGSTTSNHCLWMTGSVPDSGINAFFENVTFQGSGTNSTSQVYIADADGAHSWEAINIHFNHDQWSTPEGTKSYHIDTVNSLVYFNGRQANNAKNSTFGYLEYSGWTNDDSPDNRGIAGLTARTDVDRTIKGSVTSGTKNVTVTTGSVTRNDIGQPVSFDDGVFNFASHVTGITSATTFTIANNASHTFTAADLAISRFSPDPNGAAAVWHIVNGHNTLQLNNTTDEGYQRFLINDGSDNLSPININGGIIQSQIQLNAACVLNINGCRSSSQFLEDIDGIQATINLAGNSISSTNLWGVTLLESDIWGVNNGTSMVPMDYSYKFNGGSFAANYENTIGVLTWFNQDPSHPGNLTTPLVLITAADVTTGGPHKRLLAWGRSEPTSGIPDFENWLEHDYDTGFSSTKGNQALPNRGYQFDANVYTDTTFNGGVISPAQITANDGNYNPGDSSLFIRLTTDASRALSGLGLTGTSLFAALSGEIHQIWNVGTHNLVLLHQNAGSSAANRFLMDTGANITLLPNEGCCLWYDGVTSRWRVSKGNISGLSSDGATITAGIAVDIEDNLTVVGTIEVDQGLTVGPGNAFTAEFSPSGTGAGLITLGNFSGNQYVRVDETGAQAFVVADDIEITGSTQITGTTTVVGPLKVEGSGGLGYGVGGTGGTVAQGTSRTTAVAINKVCGAIALFTAVGSATPATFTVNNSTVAATDTIILNQKSGTDAYGLYVSNVAAGSFNITVVDLVSVTLESPVITFAVIKATIT